MGQMKPGRKPDPPLDPGRYLSGCIEPARNFGSGIRVNFVEISCIFSREGRREGQAFRKLNDTFWRADENPHRFIVPVKVWINWRATRLSWPIIKRLGNAYRFTSYYSRADRWRGGTRANKEVSYFFSFFEIVFLSVRNDIYIYIYNETCIPFARLL